MFNHGEYNSTHTHFCTSLGLPNTARDAVARIGKYFPDRCNNRLPPWQAFPCNHGAVQLGFNEQSIGRCVEHCLVQAM